jgi:SAM-dependent methyltransferase|mmetsp:Transcript_103629/g.161565  ORF Transcript_103629/g.161565 Transcript_103629/m.161565 type:complete len:278 (+) Transcript_103629:59-892(+)
MGGRVDWYTPHFETLIRRLVLLCSIPKILGFTTHGKAFLKQQPAETSQELRALYALDAIYEGRSFHADETAHQQNKAQKDVYNETGDGAASVYGEMQPSAVLEMFRVTGIKEGQKYYDLGSGYGKTVVLAWLRGLNATGVELSSDRWHGSCQALKRSPDAGVSGPGNGIRFIRANFFDVDFLDADLVFLNSVMFSDETMQSLARIARNLKPGSKIVSSHMGLPGYGFRKIGELKGSVSWTNRNSRWTIQTPVAREAKTSSPDPHKAGHSSYSDTCTL